MGVAPYYGVISASILGYLVSSFICICVIGYKYNMGSVVRKYTNSRVVSVAPLDYVLEKTHHLSLTVCYQWYEALIITSIITIVLYPIILYSMRVKPIFIGKT